MSKLSIKLNYNGEFRRLSVSQPSLNISELRGKATAMFPGLRDASFTFSWVDEDGDSIKFNSNEELQDALSFYSRCGKQVFKFDVETKPLTGNTETCFSSTDRSKAIHVGVKCDECGIKPIVGVRYKCSVRDDFDLCAHCEAKNTQPHSMLKIYYPGQAPLAVMISVKDNIGDIQNQFGDENYFGRHRHGYSRGPGHPGPVDPHPFPRHPHPFPRHPHPHPFQGHPHSLQGHPHPTAGHPFSGPRPHWNGMDRWAGCAKNFVDTMDTVKEDIILGTNQTNGPLTRPPVETLSDGEQRIVDVIRITEETVGAEFVQKPETVPVVLPPYQQSTSLPMRTNNKDLGSATDPESVSLRVEAETVKEETSQAQAAQVNALGAVMDIWSRVYEVELALLHEMGFSDKDTIIPLLREHVKSPAPRTAEARSNVQNNEAMQRVVIALLGQSLTA